MCKNREILFEKKKKLWKKLTNYLKKRELELYYLLLA